MSQPPLPPARGLWSLWPEHFNHLLVHAGSRHNHQHLTSPLFFRLLSQSEMEVARPCQSHQPRCQCGLIGCLKEIERSVRWDGSWHLSDSTCQHRDFRQRLQNCPLVSQHLSFYRGPSLHPFTRRLACLVHYVSSSDDRDEQKETCYFPLLVINWELEGPVSGPTVREIERQIESVCTWSRWSLHDCAFAFTYLPMTQKNKQRQQTKCI